MAYELIQAAEATESLPQFCNCVSFLLVLVPVSSPQAERSSPAGKDTAETHGEDRNVTDLFMAVAHSFISLEHQTNLLNHNLAGVSIDTSVLGSSCSLPATLFSQRFMLTVLPVPALCRQCCLSVWRITRSGGRC